LDCHCFSIIPHLLNYNMVSRLWLITWVDMFGYPQQTRPTTYKAHNAILFTLTRILSSFSRRIEHNQEWEMKNLFFYLRLIAISFIVPSVKGYLHLIPFSVYVSYRWLWALKRRSFTNVRLIDNHAWNMYAFHLWLEIFWVMLCFISYPWN